MAQAQNPNQPIFQIFLPSIYRGASPDVETNDDLDGRDNATTSQISAPASPNASSSTSGSFPLLNTAPGMYFWCWLILKNRFWSSLLLRARYVYILSRAPANASFHCLTGRHYLCEYKPLHHHSTRNPTYVSDIRWNFRLWIILLHHPDAFHGFRVLRKKRSLSFIFCSYSHVPFKILHVLGVGIPRNRGCWVPFTVRFSERVTSCFVAKRSEVVRA